MEEGFAAQLLGMGTQLRGGDAAGEGLPLGALSGLLADMLPTGEALQSLGRASSGPTWFSLAKSKTKTKTNPKTKTATDSNPAPAAGSPGASPQAGARRSPWDSFSSLSSANNGPASGGGGAPAPPAPAPGAADGAVRTGSPCTPPPPPPLPGAARSASGALGALWPGKGRGSEAAWGAPDGPPSLGPQPAPHGAAADQDAEPRDGAPCGGGRQGRRARGAGALRKCACGRAAPATLSASSSCASFVTAGSDSDGDAFEEAPEREPAPLTLEQHLSAAIAELAGEAAGGPAPQSRTPPDAGLSLGPWASAGPFGLGAAGEGPSPLRAAPRLSALALGSGLGAEPRGFKSMPDLGALEAALMGTNSTMGAAPTFDARAETPHGEPRPGLHRRRP